MYVVALTGGIGSGKSEASRIFDSLGVPVVDVDVISRDLTGPWQPIVQEIAKVFGKEFVAPDGSLDRTAMRDHVFSNDAERKKLESILHPAIHSAALKQLDKNRHAPYQIIAIPLFFETNRYSGIVKNTLLIDCDEAIQISRAVERIGVTEATARSIIAAQASRSFRRALATDIIENEGSLESFIEKVKEKHKKYMQACVINE